MSCPATSGIFRKPTLNCVSISCSTEQQQGQDMGSANISVGLGLAANSFSDACPSCLFQCLKCVLNVSSVLNVSFAIAPWCGFHIPTHIQAICFLKPPIITLISPPAPFQEVSNCYYSAHRHMQLAKRSLMVGASGKKKGCVQAEKIVPSW